MALAKDFENVYLERTAMQDGRGMPEPFEVKALSRIVREML